MKEVKFYNISKLNKKYENNFIKNFKKINKKGRYILGDNVKKFENNLKEYLNCKYSYVCSSGTAAIHLAMLSINLKKDDVILMPAVNFIASYKGELEMWYQKNLSFIVDLKIIFLTAWVVLFPKSQLVFKLFKNLPMKPDFL